VIEMSSTATWGSYTFNVHAPSTSFLDVAGIYIFAGVTQQKLWAPLYIGQAASLSNRLSGHEKWPQALRLGATHVHAMAVQRQADRDQIEEHLIKRWQPTLNSQLK
jgi:excinuclease UvrABC nuclease subunit